MVAGNKIFGAALLRQAISSLVVAETNNEIENPLWHGEVHALKRLYELPAATTRYERSASSSRHMNLARSASRRSPGPASTTSIISSRTKTRGMAFSIPPRPPHPEGSIHASSPAATTPATAIGRATRSRSLLRACRMPSGRLCRSAFRDPQRNTMRLVAAAIQQSKTGNEVPPMRHLCHRATAGIVLNRRVSSQRAMPRSRG